MAIREETCRGTLRLHHALTQMAGHELRVSLQRVDRGHQRSFGSHCGLRTMVGILQTATRDAPLQSGETRTAGSGASAGELFEVQGRPFPRRVHSGTSFGLHCPTPGKRRWRPVKFRIRDAALALSLTCSTPRRFVRCSSPVDPESELSHSL